MLIDRDSIFKRCRLRSLCYGNSVRQREDAPPCVCVCLFLFSSRVMLPSRLRCGGIFFSLKLFSNLSPIRFNGADLQLPSANKAVPVSSPAAHHWHIRLSAGLQTLPFRCPRSAALVMILAIDFFLTCKIHCERQLSKSDASSLNIDLASFRASLILLSKESSVKMLTPLDIGLRFHNRVLWLVKLSSRQSMQKARVCHLLWAPLELLTVASNQQAETMQALLARHKLRTMLKLSVSELPAWLSLSLLHSAASGLRHQDSATWSKRWERELFASPLPTASPTEKASHCCRRCVA